jgi:hypothetical protein
MGRWTAHTEQLECKRHPCARGKPQCKRRDNRAEERGDDCDRTEIIDVVEAA